MRRWMFGLSAVVTATVGIVGCGVGSDCDFGFCAGPAVGTDGGDGGGDDGPPVIPADCELSKSPKDSKPCIADSVAIFVDKNGKPGAPGTMAAPVPTIGEAIAKATATKRSRVYICDGAYSESIKLTAAINIFGGFDCTWANTGVKPKVKAPTGPGIELTAVGDLVVIEDLDVTGASDANVKGSSAYGVVVVDSKLTLRRTTVSAGPGQGGNKGTSRSNYAAAASAGNQSNGTAGGPDKTCTCADGTKSTGGHGADGLGTNQSDGSSVPSVGVGNSGATMPSMCGAGNVGAPGEPPGLSEPISAPGSLSMTGWDISKLGEIGKNGGPGQGGGGGGAKTNFTAPGGGGGCGGCGGAGGMAGENGGASIGVVSINSVVIFEAGSVATSVGGKGGSGGDGQPGQGGGAEGLSANCAGGTGGPGAGGAGGPGGAGGDSIAVVSSGGVAPAITDVELNTGTGGPPGDGGGAGLGSGTPGPVGKPGIVGRKLPTLRQP